MKLPELLRQRKEAVASAWMDRILASYSADAGRFWKKEKDPFANPVGQTFATESRALLDSFLEGMEAEKLCGHLEAIIRIRSVQELTPGQAMSFVLQLKDAVSEVLGKEMQQPGVLTQYLELCRRIDQLALFAFDIYTKCREQVYQLRVNEVKRQVSGLMRRLNWDVSDSGSEEEPDGDNLEPH
jgi:hypothetical protein